MRVAALVLAVLAWAAGFAGTGMALDEIWGTPPHWRMCVYDL